MERILETSPSWNITNKLTWASLKLLINQVQLLPYFRGMFESLCFQKTEVMDRSLHHYQVKSSDGMSSLHPYTFTIRDFFAWMDYKPHKHFKAPIKTSFCSC